MKLKNFVLLCLSISLLIYIASDLSLFRSSVLDESHYAQHSPSKTQNGSNDQTLTKSVGEESEDVLKQITISQEKFSEQETILEVIDVVLIIKNAATNSKLQRKFDITVASILKHTSHSINWHVFGDDKSLNFAQSTLTREYAALPFEARSTLTSNIKTYDLENIEPKIQDSVDVLMKFFTGRHAYYKDPLFFLSTTLHRVLDPSISKVIMMDIDLKLTSDIGLLFGHFKNFTQHQAIGIGYEMQPVYRHLLWSYRSKNIGTHIGEPSIEGGHPGFNSGVLLLDLDKLRKSQLFLLLNQEMTVKQLVEKYDFTNAHLGDQDFYTVTSFEHPELYHVLPCSWNRQLCRWWEDKGYQDIFNDYFDCHEKRIHLYHGNCDTPIPI